MHVLLAMTAYETTACALLQLQRICTLPHLDILSCFVVTLPVNCRVITSHVAFIFGGGPLGIWPAGCNPAAPAAAAALP